jgi:hypothetical protein
MKKHQRQGGGSSKSATVVREREKILVGDVKLSTIIWVLLLVYP